MCMMTWSAAISTPHFFYCTGTAVSSISWLFSCSFPSSLPWPVIRALAEIYRQYIAASTGMNGQCFVPRRLWGDCRGRGYMASLHISVPQLFSLMLRLLCSHLGIEQHTSHLLKTAYEWLGAPTMEWQAVGYAKPYLLVTPCSTFSVSRSSFPIPARTIPFSRTDSPGPGYPQL